MAATNEKMKKKRIVRGLAMAFGVLGGGGIYKRREPSKQTSTAEEQSCALACKAEGGDVVLAAPSASGQLYEERMDNSIRLGVRSRLLVGGALFFFLLLCVRHHRFLVANCRESFAGEKSSIVIRFYIAGNILLPYVHNINNFKFKHMNNLF
jgi:hypothetical protein